MTPIELTFAQQAHATTLVAAWLGCAPDELTFEPARNGHSTPIFRVGLDGQVCYLRLSETSEASLGPEAVAHEVLLSYGARVPAVIGYEPFDRMLNRSVMLTTAIPGSSLDDAMPADPSAVLFAAGADLARIHRVPVQGFGWISRDDPLPARLSAPFAAWDGFAADLTSRPLDGWFEPTLLAQIETLARLAPADPTQVALAHGDFDTSHIFALHGQYTGIIDFGEIRGAEPTFDLGPLELHAPAALPFILQGYASATPLPEDASRQIAASAIRIGWFRLTQSSARTNPAYAAELVAGMTRLALHA